MVPKNRADTPRLILPCERSLARLTKDSEPSVPVEVVKIQTMSISHQTHCARADAGSALVEGDDEGLVANADGRIHKHLDLLLRYQVAR